MNRIKLLKAAVVSSSLFIFAAPALAAVAPPPVPTSIANGAQTTSNQTLSIHAEAAGDAAYDALNGLAALAVAAKNGDKVAAATALALVKDAAARAKASAALATKNDTTGGQDSAIAQASADRAQKALEGALQVYQYVGMAAANDAATNTQLSNLLMTIATLTNQTPGKNNTVRPRSQVRAGSSKSEVLKLQLFLIQKGYLRVSGSGSFGPATTAALKAFQKAKGLSQTGSVGPSTLIKIATE